MTQSLLSNEPECFVCRLTYNLHRHHIYGGYGRRDRSEKWGCWVYLCARHHVGKNGVHNNKALDDHLKTLCQRAWEKKYGTRDEFTRIFEHSYL